jgi:hypothetical protein
MVKVLINVRRNGEGIDKC